MKRIVLIPLLIFSLSIGSIFIGGGTPAEAKRAEKKQPRISRRHRLARKTLTPRKKRSRISSRRTTRRSVLKKSRISRKRRSSRKSIRAKRIHASKRRGKTSRRQVQLKSQQEAIRLQQQTTEAQRQADATRQEQEAAEQQRQAEETARLEREAAEQRHQTEAARLEREAEQQRQSEAARLEREAAEQRHQAEVARLEREAEQQRQAEAARLEREAEQQRQAEAARLEREAEQQRQAEETARLEREAAEQRHQTEAARLEREAAEQRHQTEAARLEREAEQQRQSEAARLEREAAEQRHQAEVARLEREAEQQRQAEAARLEREAEQQRQAEETARRREQEAAEAETARRREQEAAEAEAARRREQEATEAEAARLEREAAEQRRQAEETARLEREAEQQRQAEAARLEREAEQQRQAEETARHREQEAAEAETARRREQEATEAEAARRREQEAAEAEAARRREQEAAEAEAARRREQEAAEAEAIRRREQEAAEAEAARLEREAAEQRRQAEATARLEQEAELQRQAEAARLEREAEQRRQAEELKNLLAETAERQKQANTRIGNVIVYRILNEEDLAEVVSNVHEDIQAGHIGSGAHEIEEVLKQAALKKQINKYIMRNQDPMYEYTKLHQDEALRVVQQTFLRITQGEHLETALTSVICLNRNMREFNVGEEEAKKIGKFIGIGQNYMPREKAKNLYDAIQEIAHQGNKGTSEEIERNILYALEVNEENCELLTSEHFREETQRLNDHIHDQWEEGQDPEDNLKRIFDDIERQKSQDTWAKLDRDMNDNLGKVMLLLESERHKKHRYADRIGNLRDTVREHTLEEDFRKLEDYFQTRMETERTVEGTRFNYMRFYYDPFLSFYLDADQLLPQIATNEDMLEIEEDIVRAYLNHKEGAVRDKAILPDEIFKKCVENMLIKRIAHREAFIEENEEEYNTNMERRLALRKRMIRAYKYFTEGENALDPNPEIAKAKFALKLSKNDETRCIEGVEDWLMKIELKHIYRVPKNGGFGLLVSQLLNEDKINHFEKHKPTSHELPPELNYISADVDPDNFTEHQLSEFSTGAYKLAIQRCRHGFALPVPYARQDIGFYGGLSDSDFRSIYNPLKIVKRFFNGGEIEFFQRLGRNDEVIGIHKVTFEPYTPDTLINRVHQAWRSGKIRDELVQSPIKADYVLNEAHRKVFRDRVELENDYFRYVPLPDNYEDLIEEEKLELKANTTKPAVFERLLVKTGFLENEIESQQ